MAGEMNSHHAVDLRHVVVIAGEESGDVLGGRLCEALRARFPNIRLSGVGGTSMRNSGGESAASTPPVFENLFEMTDLSVMGLVEVLPALPRILRRMKQVVTHIHATRPDLVITIDAPDFNFRVAKRVRALCPDIKLIHYVAPTVWAWRAGRAQKIAAFLDGLMCVLPFEPPYFEPYGLAARYVGHPLTAKIDPLPSRDEARENLGLSRDAQLVCLLFGSRKGEVKRLGADLAAVLRLVDGRRSDTVFLIPALPHVKGLIEEALAKARVTASDQLRFIAPQDRYMAFRAVDCAVAVSGTVGLELAYAGTPHCIAYRMNRLSFAIGKQLVKVAFAHLGNIMMGRRVFPEFIQDDCKPQDIADFVEQVLAGGDVSDMRRGIADIKNLIRHTKNGKTSKSAADQAIDFIIDVLRCSAHQSS